LAGMIKDFKLSWDLYSQALTSDFDDIQGGTTAEGIHAGVMAGTVLIALFSYAGVNLKGEVLRINPQLPSHWRKIAFSFQFKNVLFHCEIDNEEIRIKPIAKNDVDISIEAFGSFVDLHKNSWTTISNKIIKPC
jgi:trehalose/maltose hydrolase-like predicted phosphorylase